MKKFKLRNRKLAYIRAMHGGRLQSGFTLLEMIAVIALGAVLIAGALKLFNSSTSKSNSLAMAIDLNALRTNTQSLYNGQGGYGTGVLNQTLITASQVPTDLTVSGSSITTSNGGAFTITGATNAFTIALSNLPSDVCSSMVANSSTGWKSVQVGTGAAITAFPVSPDTATSDSNCGGTPPFTVTWTSTQ